MVFTIRNVEEQRLMVSDMDVEETSADAQDPFVVQRSRRASVWRVIPLLLTACALAALATLRRTNSGSSLAKVTSIIQAEEPSGLEKSSEGEGCKGAWEGPCSSDEDCCEGNICDNSEPADWIQCAPATDASKEAGEEAAGAAKPASPKPAPVKSGQDSSTVDSSEDVPQYIPIWGDNVDVSSKDSGEDDDIGDHTLGSSVEDTGEDDAPGNSETDTGEGDIAEDASKDDTSEDAGEENTAADSSGGTGEDDDPGHDVGDDSSSDTGEDDIMEDGATDKPSGYTTEDSVVGDDAADDATADTGEDDSMGDDATDNSFGDTGEDDAMGNAATDDSSADTGEEGTAGDDTADSPIADTGEDDATGDEAADDSSEDTGEEDATANDATDDASADTGEDDSLREDAVDDSSVDTGEEDTSGSRASKDLSEDAVTIAAPAKNNHSTNKTCMGLWEGKCNGDEDCCEDLICDATKPSWKQCGPIKCVPNGVQCNRAKCCSEEGMTCYKKDDGWSGCNRTCDPYYTWDKVKGKEQWVKGDKAVWECSLDENTSTTSTTAMA